MENIIYLKKDEVYFYAAFLDEDLTIPCIDTYIYLGVDEEKYYLFKDASDETVHLRFPMGETISVYDRASFSKWLLEDHSPTHPMLTEYKYKAL